MRVRPVYSHYILIPAIILFCLSIVVGRFPVFKIPQKIIFLLVYLGLSFSVQPVQAQDNSQQVKKIDSPEIKKDLELIKAGKADRSYILKTAEKMLRSKDEKRATELYNEYGKKEDSEAVQFNHATALLKSDRLKEALPIVQGLFKSSKDEELKDKLRKNLSLYTEQKKKQNEEQKKKDEKKDEKKEGEKDKKEDQDSKDGKNGKDGKEQNKSESQGSDQKNNKPDKNDKNKQESPQKLDKNGKPGEDKKEDKKEEKKEDKKEDKEKKDGKEGEEKEEDKQSSKPSTLSEKEKEIEQKRRMTKTPAMIKQIMSDDRELQKKMMDTSTMKSGEQKPKRDW